MYIERAQQVYGARHGDQLQGRNGGKQLLGNNIGKDGGDGCVVRTEKRAQRKTHQYAG